jgi:hypothetical protein
VDKSEIIRTEIGTHNMDMVAVHGVPCAMQPRNSNSKSADIESSQ